MYVLGIETSCDETAAAIVTEKKDICANIIASQMAEHKPYGGVVPEIASRAHIRSIENTITDAMNKADIDFDTLDGIAVTTGPGLIGGLIVGVMVAKSIASVLEKPFISVNHLEGHALTVRLTNNVRFPFLLLLVSGGHCQIVIVEGVGQYRCIGKTLDDALGESFDKTAKILGLDYPGGPAIEHNAKTGNPLSFEYPRPLIDRANCDFSFSGLKTAIYRSVKHLKKPLSKKDIADVAASFQYTVGDIIENRLSSAIEHFSQLYPNDNTLVVAGGVAANQYLNERIKILCNKNNFNFVSPPIPLCTDNGAMIAWAGIERLQLGLTDSLDTAPKARWSLEEL